MEDFAHHHHDGGHVIALPMRPWLGFKLMLTAILSFCSVPVSVAASMWMAGHPVDAPPSVLVPSAIALSMAALSAWSLSFAMSRRRLLVLVATDGTAR